MTDFIKKGVKVAVVATAGLAVFAAGFVTGSVIEFSKAEAIEKENNRLKAAFKDANKSFKKVVKELKDIINDIDDDDIEAGFEEPTEGLDGFEEVCACGNPFGMGACEE